MSGHPDRRPEHAAAAPEAASVRPYTLTGGRTGTATSALALEALVRAVAGPGTDGQPGAGGPAPGQLAAGPEKRRLLELTSGRYLSVAELSAHLALPLGVVRVLVGDLTGAGLVSVHDASNDPAAPAPGSVISVLERVLDGITSL